MNDRIRKDIDDYIAHLRDERGLAERTREAYGRDLDLFARLMATAVVAR